MDDYTAEIDALRHVEDLAAQLHSLLGGTYKGLMSPQEQARSKEDLAEIVVMADRRKTMFRHMETLRAISANEHLGAEGCTEDQLAEAMGKQTSTLQRPLWQLWEAGMITGSDMDQYSCRPESNEISVDDNHARYWTED